jgi:hypothetical protein
VSVRRAGESDHLDAKRDPKKVCVMYLVPCAKIGLDPCVYDIIDSKVGGGELGGGLQLEGVDVSLHA